MCHQSVGLFQREIESRGIRTAMIGHFTELTKRIRSPRLYKVDAPLGESFGKPNDTKMHRIMLREIIEFAAYGGDEEVFETPYIWVDGIGHVLPEGHEAQTFDKIISEK